MPPEIHAVRESDPAVRRREIILAGHQGRPDVARVALDDEDGLVREAAFGALGRLGRLDASDIERAADDADASVRRRAGELAAAHPTLDADRAIERLLDDDDATVVEVAAWASGERPASEPVLRRLIAGTSGHEDALVREAAVAALGALGDPTGLPTILAATKDRATVRRRAVIALAAFEGADVDAALEAALDDRDWQVRQAAEDLLDAERAMHLGLDPDEDGAGDDDGPGADAG